jgi:type III restriction enzyme
MQFQFDAEQDYQKAAIQAVVTAFAGQPLSKAPLEVSMRAASSNSSVDFTETGIANRLVLAEAQLLDNVRRGQAERGLSQSDQLVPCEFRTAAGTLDRESLPLNLTVEMANGTSKTYVYLRTIYELHHTYGFRKFVIVVPGATSRESVWKSLQMTHAHFQVLFGYPPVQYDVYDRGRLSALRDFAMSDVLQILVLNINSFARDTHLLNKPCETGIRSIEYLRGAHPIVVVDEPHHLETDARKAALAELHPLATLRYSATHRNSYNLVNSLNSVQAYDLGLVKQIEVDGSTADDNYDAAFVRLKKVEKANQVVKARLSIYSNEKSGVRQKDVTVSLGSNLYALSNGREEYREGFIVNELDPKARSVTFSGNRRVVAGELTPAVLRYQLERTVKWHFEKLLRLKPKGIKVLSLVFVDKVASYRFYDAATRQAMPGPFAVWFEEIFTAYAARPEYAGLIPFAASTVHDGYFSHDRASPAGKDTRGNTVLDQDTYSLIMRDKERLLSPDEPLQFIFSHSALRAGWDHPNVFQICTLSEKPDAGNKRQEIGCGLRLPVDGTGQRVHDQALNLLTVVTNETYENFSSALRREIQAETGVAFTGRIRDTAERRPLRLSQELTTENYPAFFDLWHRIKHRTRYCIGFKTAALITGAVAELRDRTKMPPTHRPRLQARNGCLHYSPAGIEAALAAQAQQTVAPGAYPVPDVYGYLQSRVDVTRSTLFQILRQSGRYEELLLNPQMFLDNVVGAIRRTLSRLQVAGIKYERVAGQEYELRLFQDDETEQYLSHLHAVRKPGKTLYNYVPIDDNPDKAFAAECEADERVEFYFRLPRGFLIPTPLGPYRPGWAIVLQQDRRVYFVVETKGAAGQHTPLNQHLRGESRFFGSVLVSTRTGNSCRVSPYGKRRFRLIEVRISPQTGTPAGHTATPCGRVAW